MFSGSYNPQDVCFLLKPIIMESTDPETKEVLIQNHSRHYSEMITHEMAPESAYMALFDAAMQRHAMKFASQLATLARRIASDVDGDITLVSLARAGTPVGALIGRILRLYMQRRVSHYSVSIIRDRGIDHQALNYILAAGHKDASLVFIDGWTAKGVIAAELATAINDFNQLYGADISNRLYVLVDLAGTAYASACREDYLVPPSMLGATICGLISRSILSAQHVGENDFHGCIYYHHLEAHDRSQWFIDSMSSALEAAFAQEQLAQNSSLALSAVSGEKVAQQFSGFETHQVKPGIAESTRVLMRRVPHSLIVRESDDLDVAHLIWLAGRKSVPVHVDADLPFKALALIRPIGEVG